MMTALNQASNSRPPLAVFWILVMLCLASPFLALGQDEHDHENDHAEEQGEETHSVVILTAAEQAEFGIETAVVGPGNISTYVSLPAEIHPNDDRLAHIVPRYEGIVTEVLAQVGDQVEVGQTLANIEGDASLAIYPLKTRIAGTVITKHITLGEAVNRDHAPFIIADLSTVWLDIHVFQRDLSRVREGQRVTVIPGPGQSPVSSIITYVAPVVDEDTRTAVARAVLDNAQADWRPGMFVTASVEVDSRQVTLLVPSSAIFSLHDSSIVFTSDEHGFEVREVQTGAASGAMVEILTGIRQGDVIVTQGGFTLKAELEKSSFGDGHNH